MKLYFSFFKFTLARNWVGCKEWGIWYIMRTVLLPSFFRWRHGGSRRLNNFSQLIWKGQNCSSEYKALKWALRAFLVAQWLRICLPMQGTWVQALVWEDPTCRGATKPLRHKYWACTLEPASHNYWSPCSATREATAMRSLHTATKSSPRSPQLEKACGQQWRPNAAKNKINKF